MKLIGNIPIRIIQGDTYPYIIRFKDPNLANFISEIWFTSQALNIEEKFTYHKEENVFEYMITPEKTQCVKPSEYYTYDITIKLNDDMIISETAIPLIVVCKENPVEEVI